MNAIQTSLAVLQAGSSLASKLPFIAPIAGLLLQALTMRDARVPYISSDNTLMIASPGSEAIQRGVQNCGARTRQNREITVNLCEKYNLSEEDLPASLRDILDSLQSFVSSVTIVHPDPHDLTKD